MEAQGDQRIGAMSQNPNPHKDATRPSKTLRWSVAVALLLPCLGANGEEDDGVKGGEGSAGSGPGPGPGTDRDRTAAGRAQVAMPRAWRWIDDGRRGRGREFRPSVLITFKAPFGASSPTRLRVLEPAPEPDSGTREMEGAPRWDDGSA